MSVLKIKDDQNNWQSIPTINGRTPEKGVDYWTSADKDEIVEDVLETEEISDLSDDVSNLKTAIDGKLDSPATAGTSGQVLTSDGQGGQSWEDPTGAVEDVQVNGTSIVSQGVANVPLAGTSQLGVVKFGGATYGVEITSGGRVQTARATSSIIKEGTQEYRPIVPYYQHESAFYGLAKAAGDSTQSASSNAVGAYTEEAKKAIRKMLGIPNTKVELINEITLTADATEVVIDTDSNGQPFKLSKMIVFITAGPSTTGAKDSFYQTVGYHNLNNGTNLTNAPSIQYSTATSNLCAKLIVEASPGMPLEYRQISSAQQGSSNTMASSPKDDMAESIRYYKIYRSTSTSSLIPSGATIKLYGIRYDD